MKRIESAVREEWRKKVELVGMDYHTIDGDVYWDESAYYEFTTDEVDTLESATEELHGMCMQAVGHVIKNDLFDTLRIPEAFRHMVTMSYEKNEPSMYGRFDFSYDGTGDPKLLEYNADTPTSLLEAAVVQWYWMKDVKPDADQFNTIHEKLVDFWKGVNLSGTVHMACLKGTEEDFGNVEYIRDTAIQAGYETRQIFIEDIGWEPSQSCFVDMESIPIEILFKLYPWEWMFADEFGSHLPDAGWAVLEPPWKSILSNKGILAVLWKLFPDHPNLLPAYFDNKFARNFVRKPLFSREGDSILIDKNGTVVERQGTYGSEGHIFQRYHPLPEFAGNYPSIGSWVINGAPAGIGVREDRNEITSNTSRFLPHVFN